MQQRGAPGRPTHAPLRRLVGRVDMRKAAPGLRVNGEELEGGPMGNHRAATTASPHQPWRRARRAVPAPRSQTREDRRARACWPAV